MQIDFYRFGRVPSTLVSVVILAVFLSPLMLVGAETDPPVDDKPVVTGVVKPAVPEPQSVVDGAAKAAVQTPPASPPVPTPLPAPVEQFTPTDKIGADSAVSFPIDI